MLIYRAGGTLTDQHRVQRSPPLDCIVSQLSPGYNHTQFLWRSSLSSSSSHLQRGLSSGIVPSSSSAFPACYIHLQSHTSWLAHAKNTQWWRSRNSSVGIATAGEELGRGRGKIFFSSPQRPDRLWGPHSLLSNGHRGLLPPG
jgi:hypothetical protein